MISWYCVTQKGVQNSARKGRHSALAKFDKHLYPSVHRGIVRAALKLLALESHPAAERFSALDYDILIEEAAAPDQFGDRHQGRGLHYYNSVKPDGTALPQHYATAGFCNGKGAHAPSPLTVLDAEYRTALALRRAGKDAAAMKSLSRSLHMLADICCPPHSCALTYFSPYGMAHKRYESRAAELFWNCSPALLSEERAAADWAALAVGKIPVQTYTNLLCGSIPVSGKPWQPGTLVRICNTLAKSGAKHLDAVLGSDEAARDRSIRERLLTAIANCAALLIAFDRELNEDHPAIWREQHPYWLKSFHSAFVVSREPFYLQFADDGTVSFTTPSGKCLAVGRHERVLLTAPRPDVMTQFRFGREPLLTLYPNGDQKRLLAQIRGQLYCTHRVSGLQGNLFIAQVSFALLNQPPKNVRFLFS